jgi:hypothetical protein
LLRAGLEDATAAAKACPGFMIAVIGFFVLLLAPGAAAALTGFLLIGLGASNIVPVYFRRAGSRWRSRPSP